jgi:Ca2+-binding EF-hand superfamily protein
MKRVAWSLVVGVVLVGEFAVGQTPGVDNPPSGVPAASGFGYGPSAAAEQPSNPLFDAIDADRDGTLTTRELRKAAVALKRFDTDKDGKITRAETLNNVAAAPANNSPAGMGTSGGFGNRGGGFSGDPRPGGPNVLQFDKNGDGQVSAEEMPAQMRSMLRNGDQNGDGRLDTAELQNLQQRINERARGDRPLPPGVSVGPEGVSGTPR